MVRPEPILVQEKYLIRFIQVLLRLGGFRTEICKKVHRLPASQLCLTDQKPIVTKMRPIHIT